MPDNVVWIMTDQHRRDCVGAYARQDCRAHDLRTPNLDRLADRSVVFDRHYSTCPLCVPARCSLHTGRYAHSCGAIVNGFSPHGDENASTLNADEITVGELLAEAGYHVGHVDINHVRTEPPLPKRGGFDTFISTGDYGRYLKEKGLERPDMSPHQQECPTRFGDEIRPVRFSAPNPGRHPFAPEDFQDFYFAREAARFVREAPADEPYFLMCFLWMPHPPFVIPEPYFSMYSPEDIELPPNVPGTQAGKPRMHLEHLPGQVGANRSLADWRKAWAAYYGCVTLVDECIGMVLEAVEARGDDDQTLIIFHPDHGEMLGAHDYFQKMVCYEEAIHLPMMVSAPDMQPGRRDCLTSHVDIMPTILTHAGVEQSGRLQGKPLQPVLSDPTQQHHDAVFSEYNGNIVPDLYQRCVVSGDHKYIWNRDDIEELYNLREDPYEMHNLAGNDSAQPKRRELRERLAAWMNETGDFLALE